jgi:hypothetical protein
MRPVAVVVLDVLVDYAFEMSTTEDEYPIQTLTSDRADEAFGECIGTRCPDRSTNNPNGLRAEDLIEAGGELGDPGSGT